uniref:ATP synthase subunit a n=1 Tax=Laevipilina antarctica TaxID=358449 RepID=A0A1L6BZY9_9MOLL|nr:ATP synthase F0 subunit 6 [Laevipilina antarctica]APQ42964.1 ATP synthase F0 subunit 6 [Laevipilina antarctica]
MFSLSGMVWVMALWMLVLVSGSMWASASRLMLLAVLLKKALSPDSMRSFGAVWGGFVGLLASIFFCIISLNFAGLIPYVFSPTSHLAVTLGFSLPLWMSMIVSGVLHSPLKVLASLMPEGAPWYLASFLVLVETLSVLVRPLTLAIRLAANIGSGHILLGLVGGYLAGAFHKMSFSSVFCLFIVSSFYFLFEFVVAVLQGYIFFVLGSLYSDDHPL